MFALIQNGVVASINSTGFSNAVMGENDYVTECDNYSVSGKSHDKKTGLFTDTVKSAEDLAAEAQAYLNSTDYIYLSQKEKGLSDEEVAEKYADIITKRIEQRAIVSAYEDSL